MSWNVLYNEETRVVELINEGEFTPQDLLAEVPAAFLLSVENNTNLFLIDGSGRKKLAVSSFDYYDVQRKMENFSLGSGTRIAMILPEGSDSDTGMTFFETICRNRGYNARIFKTRQQAENWLQENV